MAAAPANVTCIILVAMHSFTARLPGTGWVLDSDPL
jgi:hypothetical protein